jgi:hypothetical protein
MSFWANFGRTPSPARINYPPGSQSDESESRGGRFVFSGARKDYFQFLENYKGI